MDTLPEPRDIWVVAELDAQSRPTSLSLEMVGGARMMADSLGCYVHAVVIEMETGAATQDLIAAGADRVHVAQSPALQQPEAICRVLGDLLAAQPPEILMLGATRWGDELAPRLAQRFNTGLLSRCTSLYLDESERVLIGTRPVFDGEYAEVVACPVARPEIVTVEPNTFPSPYLDSYRFGETEQVAVEPGELKSRVRVIGPVDYTPPEVPLRRAKRVVSVGRQAGDVEQVKRLASVLGAHLAGAREAVEEGWITEEQVVGATGETVRPEMYMAVGIRGDTYHTFGVRDAHFIVALHPDKDAPIFKIADAGLVGDPSATIPELIAALT